MIDEQTARRILFFSSLQETDKESAVLTEPLLEKARRGIDPDARAGSQLSNLTQALEHQLSRRIGKPIPDFYQAQSTMWKFAVFPLCFFLGLATNYLGPSSRVNLLLNPVMVLLVWNLAVYFFLLLKPLLGNKAINIKLPFTLKLQERLNRRVPSLPKGDDPNLGLLLKARLVFIKNWLQKYPELPLLRWSALFHGWAATLALGIIAGLYLRGLVQEYQFVWSSTFIQRPETLEAILGVFFAPILWALNPFPNGLTVAQGEGAPWIHLFALACLFYILIPRLWLALRSRSKAKALARSLPLQTDTPVFLRWLGPLTGKATSVRTICYSYRPSQTGLTHLERAARAVFGRRIQCREPEMVEWGETQPSSPEDLEGEQAWVLCFNGTQTPEDEVHGAYVHHIMDAALPDKVPLLVVVDGANVSESSLEGRRSSWLEVLERGGPLRPAWLNLTSPAFDHDDVQSLADAVWRWH